MLLFDFRNVRTGSVVFVFMCVACAFDVCVCVSMYSSFVGVLGVVCCSFVLSVVWCSYGLAYVVGFVDWGVG